MGIVLSQETKDDAEDKKVISVRIRRKPEPKIEPTPLFSQADIRKFVVEFVSSWIRGDIIIRFPTASELARKTPLSIAFPTDPSVNAELKIKEHYVNQLSIIAGTKPASADEQEKAISEVFRMLLMFRSANRIEGKIISNDLEKRIENLEKKTKNHEQLLDKITGFLFKPKTSKKKRKR
jgi:type IV secretory pathway VirB4 component